MTCKSPIVPGVTDDAVIAAIADPSRRAILDALRRRDGQTVSELGATVPHLGRHAVLKHLATLERCELVITRKVGRQRYCYLNPVPLVGLARRWLDDYGASWGAALRDLRNHVESEKGPAMSTNEHASAHPPRHVHRIVIAAPAERVWQALTSEHESSLWYFGTGVHSTFDNGAPYEYRHADGRVAIAGVVERAEPPHLLVMTFSARWNETVAADAATRVTFELTSAAGLTTVTVVHEGFATNTATYEQVTDGWPYLLSNLKSYLETGAPMPA